MQRLARCLALLSALCACAMPSCAQEIRAFWADAFNEAIKTPEQVDTLLRRLREANCNAIFAQVRKGGDAYYLSRYDPWASDDPQHFDALACLIEKAHHSTPRIAVHAWINTCAVGGGRKNPHHIALAHPEFLSLSDKGEDYDNEATKIDPGHPDAADWTFRVYLDVARHYDVDGIHFDFVRYGGPNWGYNPVNVARFNARNGRTGQPAAVDPAWKQWRRDQVTALVRKVYALAGAVKPGVQVSAATITWGDGPQNMRFWNEKSAPMNRVFQDWRAWMQEGILDLNCQMAYYSEQKHPDWFRRWIDWGKDHQYRRWAVPGCGLWLNPIADSLQQIRAIRKPSRRGYHPKGGVLLYSYAGTDSGPGGSENSFTEVLYTALSHPSPYASEPPFARPAEYPALPWKANPTTGHLYGFALTADSLNPVDGAKVTLRGRTRRAQTTDGTGCFAFVDLPPGNYTVRVEAKGYSRQETKVTVEKGRAAAARLFMGSAPTAFTPGLRALASLPAGAPVRFRALDVLAGNDVFADSLFVADADGGRARVRLARRLLLVFQAGDVVAVCGTAVDADGERIIDGVEARLVGMTPYTDEAAKPEAAERVRGRDLAAGRDTIAPWVRVAGRVTEVKPDRFLLDDGMVMEVMLTGRRDPGVESAETAIPAPAVGSYVEVTALAAVTPLPDGKTLLRLRPRNAEAVRALTTPLSDYLKTGAGWVAGCCFRGARLAVVE